MKSTIGGYLSLVNSHSPKTNQSFSFSDTECGGSADNSNDEDENTNIKVKNRWKRGLERTRSSSLIKNALHLPKCLKSKSGNQSVCKSIKKSFALPNKSSFRSKSDNCLHKISSNNNQYNKVQINQDLTSSVENKKTFSQRVAQAFASLVLNNNSELENCSSVSCSSAASTQDTCEKFKIKESIVKSTSLERHLNCRLSEAEEQARRTRSLERNHRHLVTIDSTCRYSREVGSTQINLPQLDTNSRISDLVGRYHPDPTWKAPTSIRRPLTSSSSSASTSSSASSTRSESLHSRRRRKNKMASATSTPKSKAAATLPPSSASSTSNSFVSKPARGWLHPDYLFAKDGINYNVRYMGCLEVNTSMKVLDFDTRSAIAKECINRLCEVSNNMSPGSTKRKSDSRVSRMLSDNPCLEKAGTNVQLTITSLWLKLSDLDSGNAIFVHEMPNISFASGGDADKLDFVAYVAKDRQNVRSCYVLECGGGLAQDVITTIGQAFELRFKEFLKRTPSSKPPPLQVVPAPRTSLTTERVPTNDTVEYYNDLPGKTPPEFSPVSKSRPINSCGNANLIDLHSEMGSPRNNDPEYVNGEVPNPRKSTRDPFDMSPFATNAPIGGFPDVSTMRLQLMKEEWFHGPISRVDAENLLQSDGDFLVRESQASPGQYVLTGMQSNSKKHLLLVDPEGIVRTKDRTFESVSHLINHHRDSGRPIISAESALRLVTPVRPNSRKI